MKHKSPLRLDSVRTNQGSLEASSVDTLALNKISLWFSASHSGIYDINYN